MRKNASTTAQLTGYRMMVFIPVFMDVSRGIVLSLLQFDFSYSTAIVTFKVEILLNQVLTLPECFSSYKHPLETNFQFLVSSLFICKDTLKHI